MAAPFSSQRLSSVSGSSVSDWIRLTRAKRQGEAGWCSLANPLSSPSSSATWSRSSSIIFSAGGWREASPNNKDKSEHEGCFDRKLRRSKEMGAILSQSFGQQLWSRAALRMPALRCASSRVRSFRALSTRGHRHKCLSSYPSEVKRGALKVQSEGRRANALRGPAGPTRKGPKSKVQSGPRLSASITCCRYTWERIRS